MALIARIRRLRVTAAKKGNAVGTRGTLYHFNPDAKNNDLRHPVVEEGDVDALVAAGLIDRPRSNAKQIGNADPSAVPEGSLERFAEVQEIDGEAAPLGVGPGGNQALVNYDPAQGVDQDEAGLRNEDPDAPPVTGGAGTVPAGRAERTTADAGRGGTRRSSPPRKRSGGGRAATKAAPSGGEADGGGTGES